MNTFLRKNTVLLITLAVITALFIVAAQGMEKKDFVITLCAALQSAPSPSSSRQASRSSSVCWMCSTSRTARSS